jgi:hypothetical protein
MGCWGPSYPTFEACEAARTGKKAVSPKQPAAKKQEPPKTEAVDATALKKKQQAEAARRAKAAEAEAAELKKKQQAEAARKAKAAAAAAEAETAAALKRKQQAEAEKKAQEAVAAVAAEAERAQRSAAAELETARNAGLQAMIDANQALARLEPGEQKDSLRNSIDSLAQAMEAGSPDAIRTHTALLLRLNAEAARQAEVPAEEPSLSEPQPQKRVALVIGNSAYQNAVELPNPRNDARVMSDTLRSLNFEVIEGEDLTKTAMEGKIQDFAEKVSDADVALFFYAGHGMQVSGKNYLIPIDAKLERATAVDFETIDADRVLGYMSDEDRVSIALLDACRDNPLARKFARNLGASRSAAVGQGLAIPTAVGGGLLIGFATAPGDVALDGEGKNSPFTSALIRHLPEKGLEIEQVLKRVKADVIKDTDNQQRPWVNSDIAVNVYLNP